MRTTPQELALLDGAFDDLLAARDKLLVAASSTTARAPGLRSLAQANECIADAVSSRIRTTVCAHTFVRSQSAYDALRRSLDAGVWIVAWSAARELPNISLDDALALLLLTLDKEPARYDQAAERWTERFTAEGRLDPTESSLVQASLAAMPGPAARAGLVALDVLAQQHHFDRVRLVLHERLEGPCKRS